MSLLLAVSELRKYHIVVSPIFCRLSTQNLISKSALASHGESYGSPRWRLWVGHSLLELGMWSVDCGLIDGGVGSRGNIMRLLMILRKRRKEKKDSTHHNISFSTIDCFFCHKYFYFISSHSYSTPLYLSLSSFFHFSFVQCLFSGGCLVAIIHKRAYGSLSTTAHR